MPHTMMILHFRSLYLHVSDNALFFIKYFNILILYRCILNTFYLVLFKQRIIVSTRIATGIFPLQYIQWNTPLPLHSLNPVLESSRIRFL